MSLCWKNVSLWDIQGKPLDTPSTILPKGKTFVAKTGTFLEKEFLAKGVSGRKVELDEIIDPSLEIPSSAMEAVPSAPSIEEEEGADDDDHGELAMQAEHMSARLPQIP
jgi:hypothetical protein